MTEPADIPALQDANRHLHGCEAIHVTTVPLHETHDGKTVWEGDVEVFQLVGRAPDGGSGVRLERGDSGHQAPVLRRVAQQRPARGVLMQ